MRFRARSLLPYVTRHFILHSSGTAVLHSCSLTHNWRLSKAFSLKTKVGAKSRDGGFTMVLQRVLISTRIIQRTTSIHCRLILCQCCLDCLNKYITAL